VEGQRLDDRFWWLLKTWAVNRQPSEESEGRVGLGWDMGISWVNKRVGHRARGLRLEGGSRLTVNQDDH
jgi:hypothetical protein